MAQKQLPQLRQRFRPRLLLLLGVVFLAAHSLGCEEIQRIYNTIKTGAPCESNLTCLDGACLTESDGFPGGMCSGTNCKENGCLSLFTECFEANVGGGENTYCLPTCQNGRTCERSEEGYGCHVLGDSFVCSPTGDNPLGTTPTGVTGAPCTVDSECSGNNSLCMTDLDSGYCTQTCGTDEDCIGQQPCLIANRSESATTKICFKGCSRDQDCRPGYQCKAHEGRGVCLPGTTKERNPDGTNDGTSCKSNLTCKGGTCIRENGGERPEGEGPFPYPNGYCTTRGCTTNSDCNLPDGEAICTARGRHRACFKACNDNSDCRSGYKCIESIDGKICDSAVPLPDVKPDKNSGSLDIKCTTNSTISFTVPAGAIGFYFAPFSKDGNRVRPTRVKLDGGIDLNIQKDYAFGDINPDLIGALAPMLFPASNRNRFKNAFTGGDYTAWVDSSASEICYYVIPKMSEGNRVKVKVHLVGVPGISASNAAQNPKIKTMLATMRGIYQKMGISVEVTGYIDVPKQVSRRYSIIRNFNDIFTLVATTDSANHAMEVNVFLIQDFAVSEAPGLLGISTGIPGMAGMNGTVGSGLVFTTASISGGSNETKNAKQLGQTMAHEIGHFLGLRHTTEHSGSTHDPITDTGECRTPDLQYACPDARNFMFAYAMGSDQTEATPGQAFVLRRSPLVE